MGFQESVVEMFYFPNHSMKHLYRTIEQWSQKWNQVHKNKGLSPSTKLGNWDLDMELSGLGVQIIINDYDIAFTW